MTFTRNPLDTFADDLTSIQMTDGQQTDLQAALAAGGGRPKIVSAFVIQDSNGDGEMVIPLGVDEVEEDDMWHNPIRVQVTYEVDSIDQDELRATLIELHEDLIVNGAARAIQAREAEEERIRGMVRDAERNVAEAKAEYERLFAYAQQAGVTP